MDIYMCVCKYVFVYCIHAECVSIVVNFSYHHFVYQDEKHFAVLSNKLFDFDFDFGILAMSPLHCFILVFN